MVSTVNAKIIEMILSEKMKFNDFNFDPSTWKDGFIVELLRWFDNKINEISTRKLCGSKNINDFNNWKTYYEQFVRILYYFVVYKDIQDSKQLHKIFSYLFPNIKYEIMFECFHIDSKELMSVYNYLINKTPNYLDKSFQVNKIVVLIGRWNNKERRNKLEDINNNNFEFIIYDDNDNEIYIDNYSDFSGDD